MENYKIVLRAIKGDVNIMRDIVMNWGAPYCEGVHSPQMTCKFNTMLIKISQRFF